MKGAKYQNAKMVNIHAVAHFREFNLINEYFQSINSDGTNFTLPHKITAP